MHKLSNGVDIVEWKRMEDAVAKRGDAFLQRVFTEAEIAYCTREDGSYRFSSLAARFAAKEALAKALGTGIAKGVRLLDIEVAVDENKAPFYVLHGEAKRLFDDLDFLSSSLSLSHDVGLAIAFCILFS